MKIWYMYIRILLLKSYNINVDVVSVKLVTENLQYIR